MISSCIRSSARVALRASSAQSVARYGALRGAYLGMRFFSNDLSKDSVVTKYASTTPKVKYTEEHEWIALHEDGVGITKYAADALGDATYIELPDEGTEVAKGDSIGSVESVKSASDLYCPAGGVVLEGNGLLLEDAGLVNKDPLGEGWIAKLNVTSKEDMNELMSIEQYEEFLKEDH